MLIVLLRFELLGGAQMRHRDWFITWILAMNHSS